jgi:hypothetical protein
VYQKVEATELRNTVAQLQPHHPSLKTEFEQKIALAVQKGLDLVVVVDTP